jgi:hypothetical protein
MLPPAPHFGRLILSFHKLMRSIRTLCADSCWRAREPPEAGTREHNNENPPVKLRGQEELRISGVLGAAETGVARSTCPPRSATRRLEG